MDYFPISLRLTDQPVLLVGGGTVGLRKARLLLRAGASLTVVAPVIESELEAALAEHGGIWQASEYRETDVHGRKLVIAATPDRAVNRQFALPAYLKAKREALAITSALRTECPARVSSCEAYCGSDPAIPLP